MKLRTLLAITIFSISTLLLTACGGGGGSTPPVSSASGVASAGLVRNGVVKVYGVSAVDGAKGALLASTTTDATGSYSLSLGSYIGAVLVELEGGAGGVSKYTDEATGTEVTLPAGVVFLRAAYQSVAIGVPVTIALTPLTELAVQRATVGGKTPVAAIAAANQVVSDLFNIDIVGVKPVAPTATAMNASGVSDAQRTYTLALAALSQQAGAATTAAVTALITSINSGIGATTNVMDTITATNFTTSLNAFLATANNTTGFTAASPLVTAMTANLGKRTATIVLSVTGITGQSVGTLDTTITLPATGYTFTTDSTTNLVADADLATTTGGTVAARFASPTLSVSLANATSLTNGTVSIKMQVSPGFAAGNVQLGAVTYKNLNGFVITVSGAQATVAVE